MQNVQKYFEAIWLLLTADKMRIKIVDSIKTNEINDLHIGILRPV